MNVDHLPGKPMVSLVYHYRWVPFQFLSINEHCGSFHGTLCQTATVFEQGVWDWPRGCWRIELATSDCLEMVATFFGRDKNWHTHSSRCDAEDSAHSANRAHGAEQQNAPQSHHELEGLRQLSIPPGSHGRAETRVARRSGLSSGTHQTEVEEAKSIPKDTILPALMISLCCFNNTVFWLSSLLSFPHFASLLVTKTPNWLLQYL